MSNIARSNTSRTGLRIIVRATDQAMAANMTNIAPVNTLTGQSLRPPVSVRISAEVLIVGGWPVGGGDFLIQQSEVHRQLPTVVRQMTERIGQHDMPRASLTTFPLTRIFQFVVNSTSSVVPDSAARPSAAAFSSACTRFSVEGC